MSNQTAPSLPDTLRSIARPRIWKNGLLLVLLPLAINTIWIAMLNDSLQKSQVLLDSERYQARKQAKLNGLLFKATNSFSALLSGFVRRERWYLTNGQSDFDTVRKQFIELNAMTVNDPDTHKWIAVAQSQWEKGFQTLKRMAADEMDNVDSPIPWMGQIKNIQLWVKEFGKINAEICRNILEEDVKLEHIRALEAASRRQVQTTAIIGLCANLLGALLLIFLFAKNISGRVKMLMQNAVRLPSRQPLAYQITGGDEFAELDAVLHQASKELSDAAEFRSSLMQMMAHDLRTPLSSCRVSVELISSKELNTLSASAQSHVLAISRSIDRLIALINDLLTLESLEAGKMHLSRSTENIKEIASTSIESLKPLADVKRIKIVYEGDHQYVYCDRDRMIQVMVNLLSNAIKFSPKDSVIHVSAIRQGESIKVTVKDQGEGLSQADKGQLFQKFFQTRAGKDAGGTGLGLAICKMIVDSHDGTIGADSGPGQGASFWFSLPCPEEE